MIVNNSALGRLVKAAVFSLLAVCYLLYALREVENLG